MEPIQTKRLFIREFQLEDATFLSELGNDPRIFNHIGESRLARTADDYRFWIKNMQKHAECPQYQKGFAIVHKQKLTPIGYLTLTVDQPQAAAKAGIMLKRDFWGKGFPKESGMALFDYCFFKLGIRRIWTSCRPENSSSIHVAEQLGMTCEGRLKEHEWINGQWRDMLYYSVLDHNWQGKGAYRSQQARLATG